MFITKCLSIVLNKCNSCLLLIQLIFFFIMREKTSVVSAEIGMEIGKQLEKNPFVNNC